MSTTPVLLLLGAGARVGQSVTKAFAAKGYKIALISRTQKSEEDTPEKLHLAADLSNPGSVAEVFTQVSSKLGTPSVVVYNAAGLTIASETDPLSLGLAEFTRDLHINTTSAFSAAQQAVVAFSKLPDSASRTFIYTGNILNTGVVSSLYLDLGVGKSATANFIHVAAETYKEKGFKFYYADERKADGSSGGKDIDGDAHAELYIELAEGKTQGPWQQTFVKGKGYIKF
ncbi:hypothetical protein P280DRAFT_470015 [Massarina eburnea CBS 473.64]|uniref:Short-chain dehydrogenase n=1 Tax=Massarina eburnea CBS 473.64 TaxID=1395130 RepID=A0A6A6RZU4_9PLEO|nr:hypothetical protein P280DRAFT_470015 [Massarina eburnea CBS 473.64]